MNSSPRERAEALRPNRLVHACLPLALLILFGACSRKPEASIPLIPPDYPLWSKTTELPLEYPIPGHEDRGRVIKMNKIGFSAAPSEGGERKRWVFPAGTIVVKEIYPSTRIEAGAAPIALTAMIKAPEDPRSRAGWLWVVKNLAEGVETVQNDDFCLGCHENANEGHPYGDRNLREEFRDYLFFPPTRTP